MHARPKAITKLHKQVQDARGACSTICSIVQNILLESVKHADSPVLYRAL